MDLEDNRFYNVRELCDLLRLSRATVMAMLYDGRIPGAKVGKSWRVLGSDIRKAYESMKAARTG